MDNELFFVDTEGLNAKEHATNTCIIGILTILQIASVRILYLPNLNGQTFDESMKLKPIPQKWSNFKFPENGHRG